MMVTDLALWYRAIVRFSGAQMEPAEITRSYFFPFIGRVVAEKIAIIFFTKYHHFIRQKRLIIFEEIGKEPFLPGSL